MIKKILFILISFWGISATACDCYYFGGFAYSNQLADLVVYGKVIAYDSIGTDWNPTRKMSIKFQVIEKYRGIDQNEIIEVLGDDGGECRPYISSFKPNEYYVLALNYYGEQYEISNCGEFHLLVENNYAKGRIFGREQTEPIKEIHIQKLKEIIDLPYLYPINRKKKDKKEDKRGYEYYLNCDQLPKCELSNAEINRLVNNKIKLPEIIEKSGSKYLVHANLIITKENEMIFLELVQANHYSFEYLLDIENQIRKILNNIKTWQCGLVNEKKENAIMIIPIMLE